jgi:hypothetical protein
MRTAPLESAHCSSGFESLVPTVGFEPTRLAALAPQASVSTNSTTSAKMIAAFNERDYLGAPLFSGLGAGASGLTDVELGGAAGGGALEGAGVLDTG